MSNFRKVMLKYAHSIWSGIILNKILHQWGVAWRRSACDTAEVLWKPRIALIEALNSSVWLGLLSLIFLLAKQHRFSMGLMSGQLAGQLGPVIPWSVHQLLVVLALRAGAKCSWLKEIIISIKLVNLRKHEVLQNLWIDGSVDSELQKAQWTNTSNTIQWQFCTTVFYQSSEAKQPSTRRF